MKKILQKALIGVFWIALWQGAAMLVGKPLLLPGPVDTAQTLFRLAGKAVFWQSTGMTLLRVAAGYLCAVVLGVLLAVSCHFIPLLEALFSPIRAVIRATPVSSFIMLVLLWMKKAHVPVFISFLMVLPIVWTAVQEGLKATDGQLKEMTHMYGFSGWQRFCYLYAPSVKPAFAASCMTGLGFAWKSGIAAEVLALPALSVGLHLYNAKIYLERAELFAWTFTVILLSMALEAMLKKAVGRMKGGAA